MAIGGMTSTSNVDSKFAFPLPHTLRDVRFQIFERFPAGAQPSFVNQVSDLVQATGELDAVRKGFHIAAI